MYNPTTQVQVPTNVNLGSYFQKTKIAVGASPTAFPFKKKDRGKKCWKRMMTQYGGILIIMASKSLARQTKVREYYLYPYLP
jgi:hypothetical protein